MQDDVDRPFKYKEIKKKQNGFLNTVIESLSHPFYVIDSNNYRIKIANHAATQGRKWIGKTCYAITHRRNEPCDGKEHICPLIEVKRTKKPVIVEHLHYDLKGEERPFEVHGYPIFDENDNVVQMIEYSFDITERKKMEEELLKMRKLEAITHMTGGIAHDFNNLLTIILGNLTLLEKYIEPEHANAEWLHKAEKACFLTRDLVQTYLDISSKILLPQRPSSISDLILKEAGYVFQDTDIQYDASFGEDLWNVAIDHEQIGHLFRNIFINAKEAMSNKGLVTIRCDNILNAGMDRGRFDGKAKKKYLRVIVEDQGRGIKAKDLPRIFDPYFSTKEWSSQKGTGLGLTVAYSIIKRHEGDIQVKSKPGEGTSMSIFIPAAES